jgi:DNA-3-methyladenine glycosylase II
MYQGIIQGVPSYWEEAKAHLRQSDPTLADVIGRHEEPPLCSKGDLLQTLIHSIVGQQISAKAAQAIWTRLLKTLSPLKAASIKICPDETLRQAGLSARKVEYIKGVAASWKELTNLDWAHLDDDAVREKLCNLRGIGPWTANMVLIFCMTRPNIMPWGDIGVVRAIEKLYADGQRLNRHALNEISQPWAPFCTAATWYLWRELDAEPVEY